MPIVDLQFKTNVCSGQCSDRAAGLVRSEKGRGATVRARGAYPCTFERAAEIDIGHGAVVAYKQMFVCGAARIPRP
jgi:hypothetical protein